MTRKLFLLGVFLLFTSCVYYNTFYNAERKFNDAEKNQRRSAQPNQQHETEFVNRASPPAEPTISMNDKSLYKSAIDKANRVILYHPKSKYIDDALWLVGKARYNMTEYVASDKSFRELIVKYPNSKYVDDAYFYIGMGQFWMKKYDLAIEAFDHIKGMKKSSYKDDADFIIAYIDFINGRYLNAAGSFKKYLKAYPKSDSAAAAQFFVAVCYDSLGDYLSALEAYKLIDNYKPSHELYFDAQYAYGSAALNADSINLGMSIFSKLAGQERYFNRSSLIRLKLAEGIFLSGNIDEAITEYLKVIEQFPKSDQAAEAYYHLGLIYQNNIFDLEKAKDYYNKATQEKRDSPFRNLALAKSAQISKLETYRNKLGMDAQQESNPDSTKAISDTTAVLDSTNVSDSSRPDRAVENDQPADSSEKLADIDKLGPAFRAMINGLSAPGMDTLDTKDSLTAGENKFPVLDSLSGPSIGKIDSLADSAVSRSDLPEADSLKINEDAEVRFLLAELYHHDLNQPDSALHEYILLADTYPQSEYAPKALLASAFIYEDRKDTLNAHKMYDRLVQDYPTSSQAEIAITKTDNIEIPIDQDVGRFYRDAENKYFIDNDPVAAIDLFNYIETAFPQSEYAAKSAYARAWLTDLMLTEDGDSASYLAYSEVAQKYPETPYALNAQIKMGLIEKPKPANPKKPPVQNTPREEQNPLQDSLSRARADSLRLAANTLPPAPAVKDTGEFIYPAELMNARIKQKGRVTFKIKLDLFGNIIEQEMLGTSGNDLIDSLAVQALLQTTFDMSTVKDLSTLDDYFRYDVSFEPPEGWEDRYKHNDLDSPY